MRGGVQAIEAAPRARPVGRAPAAESGPPARARFTWRFWVGACAVVLAAMAWRAWQRYPTGVFDFYPLYYGGVAWLHTGNAYDLSAVIPPGARDFQLYQIGNVYPFPAVLATLPFSLLPAQLAGTLWVGLLTAGLLVTLRLNGWPAWYLLYLPLLEGLRIEQYTVFVLVCQLLAVWAYRQRRPWLLAVCCALILTKPNQGFIFVLALALLARNWRQLLVACGALWGGALLLYPRWVADWVPMLANSHNTMHQPFYWQIALLALPLLALGDVIGGALVLQFLLLPFPGSYAASALPMIAIEDRRSLWLMPLSFCWPLAALTTGQAWATALTLVLPVVALAVWRRRGEFAGWRVGRFARWKVKGSECRR